MSGGKTTQVYGGANTYDTCAAAGAACGGTVSSNEVWISGGHVYDVVRGGSSTQGKADANKVYIKGGVFTNGPVYASVQGGHVNGGGFHGITVNSNEVEISGNVVCAG
jgi:hypothetical protein